MRSARWVASFVAVLLLAAACGGNSGDETGADGDDEGFSGYRRTPAPSVAEVRVPVLPDPEPMPLTAAPGRLRIVYFGYTSCPDVCPTTMSDLRRALFDMDEEDAARVDVMMITIDPDRDVPEKLDAYVTTFFDGGESVRIVDDAALSEVADVFGARYAVTPVDGDEPEVSHSGDLYAVDDRGDIVMQWPFGITNEDLRKDLEQLLADTDDGTPTQENRSTT